MSFQLCNQGHRFLRHAVPPRSPHVKPSAVSATNSTSHVAKYVTYIHRSVHSNERIESGGCIIIHGHVDPDAYIKAAGDVMVWGRLAGHVHAGCDGDSQATISALELRGAQLRIANVTSMATARVTVPGPHTASVAAVGRSPVMQLTPLGPCHPPPAPAGLAKSFGRWLSWYPAAMAALITGAYAFMAGLALIIAPKTVLGLVFSVHDVSAGWIRLGGVLFATFGLQYLGTALIDWRLAHSSSSIGVPDMPFRPASPHATTAAAESDEGGSIGSGSGSIGVSHKATSHTEAAAAVDVGQHAGSSSSSSSTVDSAPQQQQLGTSSGSSRSGSPWPDLQRPASPQQQQQQHAHSGAAAAAAGGGTVNAAASWLYSSLGFYEASVWSRIALAVAFTVLVVLRQCQPGVLLLAVLNLFGAIGMMNALKKQWLLHVMGDMPSAVL